MIHVLVIGFSPDFISSHEHLDPVFATFEKINFNSNKDMIIPPVQNTADKQEKKN